MRQIRLIGWCIYALVAVGAIGCSALPMLQPPAAAPADTALVIEPQRDGITVNVIVENHAADGIGPRTARALVEIASADGADAGIGAVDGTITGMRPTALIFRLHVSALEGAGFAYGETRLTAGAGPGSHFVSAQTGDGDPVQLDPADPDWLAISAFHADGRPARQTPVAGGYFEIAAPAAFLDGEETDFHLEWVDFYRQ